MSYQSANANECRNAPYAMIMMAELASPDSLEAVAAIMKPILRLRHVPEGTDKVRMYCQGICNTAVGLLATWTVLLQLYSYARICALH